MMILLMMVDLQKVGCARDDEFIRVVLKSSGMGGH